MARLDWSPQPLFVFEDGYCVKRFWLCLRLNALFHNKYRGHSMRSGGATHYANIGASEERIMAIGRWSSEAWAGYRRNHPDVDMELRRRERREEEARRAIPGIVLSIESSST